MHKIDSSTAVSVMPTPNAVGTPGWFAHGAPGGQPYTVVTSDWCNSIQGEILSVLTAAGITPDKTSQAQLLAAIQKVGRIKASADFNLYISPSGSDTTGTGLTSGSPFRTAAKAVSFANQTYDFNGYTCIINYAAGTYNGASDCTAVTQQAPGRGYYKFLGNAGSPGTVIIAPSVAGNVFSASTGANIIVQGLQMGNSHGSDTLGSVPGDCLSASLGGTISATNVIFSGTQRAHMEVGNAGYIAASTYTIAGGAEYHYIAGMGEIVSSLNTVTLTGTPAFSQYFAWAEAGGFVFTPSVTYSGSATGARYLCTNGGIIGTGGGGTSYFPGNSAGNSTGGYYS